MMSFALYFVRLSKKFDEHLCQKCLLSSPVIKPRLRLGYKTQTQTKRMPFFALIHNSILYYK
jgi:hypothetical protein